MRPHTHHGYFHNENDSKKGVSNLTKDETKMVDKVNEIWYNISKRTVSPLFIGVCGSFCY